MCVLGLVLSEPALWCLVGLVLHPGSHFFSAMSHASLYHSCFHMNDLIVRLGIWFSMAFLIFFNFVIEPSGLFVFKMSFKFVPGSSSIRPSLYVCWYNHSVRGGTCSISGETLRVVVNK